jgi:hypothetical protein
MYEARVWLLSIYRRYTCSRWLSGRGPAPIAEVQMGYESAVISDGIPLQQV